jgi:hypothetical protein
MSLKVVTGGEREKGEREEGGGKKEKGDGKVDRIAIRPGSNERRRVCEAGAEQPRRAGHF